MKLKKIKQAKFTTKLQYETLQNDPELRKQYTVEVKNRFEALSNDAEPKWESLKIALVETAKEIIPKKKNKKKSSHG